MLKFINVKRSKSNVILRLMKEHVENQDIKDILLSSNLLIPFKYLKKHISDPEWKNFIINNKCYRFYRFIGEKSPFQTKIYDFSSTTEFQKLFMMRIHSIKRIILQTEIPKDLSFEKIEISCLYYSCLCYKHKNLENEMKLLKLLEKAKNEKNFHPILSRIFIKFSNEVLLKYLKSNMFNQTEAFAFLRLIICKLNNNVLDLCFNNNITFPVEIIQKMNRIKISSSVQYDKNQFICLFPFKKFQKDLFNNFKSLEFIKNNINCFNRYDYDYYFQKLQIPHKSDCPLPKDFLDFDFFMNFPKKKNFHRISMYSKRVKNSDAFRIFVENNISDLFINEMKYEHLESISQYILNELSENRQLIQTIWNFMKKNEGLFRRTIKYFKFPPEPALFKLISGNFKELSLKEIEPFINFGYEEELYYFLNECSIEQINQSFNEWNQGFFLKYLSMRKINDSSESLNLLKAIFSINYQKLSQNSKILACKILSNSFNFSDEKLFNCINNKQIKFIYALKNKKFIPSCIEGISQNDCDLFEAIFINEALTCLEKCEKDKIIKKNILLNQETNINENIPAYIFQTAFGNYHVGANALLDSLYYLTAITSDSKYFFVEHFEAFEAYINQNFTKDDAVKIVKSYEPSIIFKNMKLADQIDFSLSSSLNISQDDPLKMISFIFDQNLRNKQNIFILFDRIIKILSDSNTPMKIILLKFINPYFIIKEKILEYIDTIIPSLYSTNLTVCVLSKASMNAIQIQNQEIQLIFQDLVQCLVDKQYIKSFLTSLRKILFNNYLCFNSLNILIQLMFKYINDYPSDCLDILLKITNITCDTHFKLVSRNVFKHLCRFLVSSLYNSDEILVVAKLYCCYTSFDDYSILLSNLQCLRVSSYLVNILKTKSDSKLTVQVIKHVVEGDSSSISPSFIASACELKEFHNYLHIFIPCLKSLFLSQCAVKRDVACKAFKQILLLDKDYSHVSKDIITFLNKCCVVEDFYIRILCLDIIQDLSILFIIRNDTHLLVRKKATDLWKERVYNANKELRLIFKNIINYIRFIWISSFYETMNITISEIITKYINIIEKYIAEAKNMESDHLDALFLEKDAIDAYSTRVSDVIVENPIVQEIYTLFFSSSIDKNEKILQKIKEFLLISCIKKNKLIDLAVDYCLENHSIHLFYELFKNNQLRERLLSQFDENKVLDMCESNAELAWCLFKNKKNTKLLKFLNESHRYELIEQLENQKIEECTDLITEVMECIAPSKELEQILLKLKPKISYYYLLKQRHDCGKLRQIIIRVFSTLKTIDELILDCYKSHLKHVSIDNVKEINKLLLMMIQEEDRASFEKASQIVMEKNIGPNNVYEFAGYFFKNYLIDSRKEIAFKALKRILSEYNEKLGYFNKIYKTSVSQSI